MRRFGFASVVIAVALSFSFTAVRAGSTQEHRKAVMQGIVGHIKALGAVAKGKAKADAGTVVHAMALDELSASVKFLFPKGSGGGDSRSKPEIWTEWDKFEAAAHALSAATPALVAAAKTGDAGQIGAAIGPVGKACGGCHKPFRKPKKK